ncbi:ribosomal RNA-processing protein 14 [Senna tora]|uniref:Ribosomal RNA-processing protein 14 n=1 Tax=Senna tora TaxID=362788 RepID=A0A834W998_9FABA|nr:ribosomal RNA-processing protein 14 [Senna tora]
MSRKTEKQQLRLQQVGSGSEIMNHMNKKMTKKRQKFVEETNAAQNLESVIHQHTLFFDKLIELIPAKFYLPIDEEKPWFQGLSKAEKAAAKKETKENIKKSRRERLDPHKSNASTLDLLKQSLDKEKLNENNNEEGDMKPFTSGSKNPGESVEKKKDAAEASKELKFGHVKLDNEERQGKKKRMSKHKELEKAKRLEEAMKDPEKGEAIAKKQSWKAAMDRASGIKVHDDPKLLQKAIKKDNKRHQKNSQKWKERIDTREQMKAEKQKRRSENIAGRIHQKKMRKIAKREKKLMRPGFEGRKEGFINESSVMPS